MFSANADVGCEEGRGGGDPNMLAGEGFPTRFERLLTDLPLPPHSLFLQQKHACILPTPGHPFGVTTFREDDIFLCLYLFRKYAVLGIYKKQQAKMSHPPLKSCPIKLERFHKHKIKMIWVLRMVGFLDFKVSSIILPPPHLVFSGPQKIHLEGGEFFF